jgi:hypothetical protein
LTELAAAINASSQMDVNIAASNATITVASHAVTNAGTFVTQVDGAALTALQLIDNLVLAEDAVHGTGDPGIQMLAVRQDVQSDFGADGDYVPLSITADGELRVAASVQASAAASEFADDEAFTLTTSEVTAIGAIRDDALSALAAAETDVVVLRVGSTGALWTTVTGTVTIAGAVTNAGTFVVQENGAALTALQLIDDVVYVDDTATHATGTSKGVGIMAVAVPTDTSISANDIGMVGMTTDRRQYVEATIAATQTLSTVTTVGTVTAVTAITNALPAGTNGIGKLTANSGVDIGDVDVTSISAGTNAIGNVGLIGRTTGGLTIFKSIDLDESEEEVKATAGQVFSITAFNRTAAPLYLKFYNLTAANTTVGTSVPVATYVVPANADSDGAGFVWNNTIGLAFSTAISAAVTTGVADNDTGAPGANDCVVVIGYV